MIFKSLLIKTVLSRIELEERNEAEMIKKNFENLTLFSLKFFKLNFSQILYLHKIS